MLKRNVIPVEFLNTGDRMHRNLRLMRSRELGGMLYDLKRQGWTNRQKGDPNMYAGTDFWHDYEGVFICFGEHKDRAEMDEIMKNNLQSTFFVSRNPDGVLSIAQPYFDPMAGAETQRIIRGTVAVYNSRPEKIRSL